MTNKNEPKILDLMTFCLILANNCVPEDKGIKRIWFKGLVSLREAVVEQKKLEN